jgi:deazaflavin-dependent oxidoreductase (nitroreductase family)
VQLNRRSRGRLGNRFRGGQVLLLNHRGRRSGASYTTPVAYARDGEDYVVAASNGGIDLERQWWLNLQAEPRSTVEVRGRRIEVVAHLVDEADRASGTRSTPTSTRTTGTRRRSAGASR